MQHRRLGPEWRLLALPRCRGSLDGAVTVRNRGTECAKSPEMLLAANAYKKVTIFQRCGCLGMVLAGLYDDGPYSCALILGRLPRLWPCKASCHPPNHPNLLAAPWFQHPLQDATTYDRRQRKGAGAASDVWSLGCLLFELVTGG